ncbi:DUF6308 family protein [Blastococcus saxobsidens]|uniref:Uncharacterized protein n=1 Tax=Blastococcus saxobsidens TaxID=138336 RepID=A0A4Q7Y2M3_9ACTN|nr:DUF6308 family protein [Blastococcus saxobsidens]RZU30758.1 hypothetical protein BKA19_0385 [Blastococcus saxobsidens]
MPFRPPEALQDPDDERALGLLRRYYGTPPWSAGCHTGAWFDTWDSTGTRERDADRFTADDLVAVSFLMVDVPAEAARRLLVEDAAVFAELLVELGPDRDLVDEPPLADDWAGWRLMDALKGLPDIGPTTASKLLARKRPRLRPIWDTVVSALTDTVGSQWEPVRSALAAEDRALHVRLGRLRAAAGLPETVSALRVLDVICWREGKDRGVGGGSYRFRG